MAIVNSYMCEPDSFNTKISVVELKLSIGSTDLVSLADTKKVLDTISEVLLKEIHWVESVYAETEVADVQAASR